MSTLRIRNLPADVREALAFRAEREHRSLAAQAIVELRRMPEIEARARRLRVLDRLAAELEQAPGAAAHLPFEPEEAIRADRDG